MHYFVQELLLPKERTRMAVRNPVVRGSRNFKGHFPSKKLNRMVVFESHLEMKAYELIEGCKYISTYQEQPEVIHYIDSEGKRKKYTPDVNVTLINGVEITVEIKPYEVMLYGVMKRKYAAIAEHLNSMGRKYLILTDQDHNQEIVDCIFGAYIDEKLGIRGYP